VAIRRLTREADTVTIEYVLANRSESLERLFRFAVDAPSGVVTMNVPGSGEDWRASTNYRGRSIVSWISLGNHHMQPGDSSPPLRLRSRGLPGIVTFWAGGRFPPPPLGPADTLPVVAPDDPLLENSVPGRTVGVEPFPASLDPASLVVRLTALLAESCQLEWIAAAACGSLDSQLTSIATALSAGNTDGARSGLNDLVQALADGFQPSAPGPVNDAAFWLLTVNAEFIRDLLPAGGGSVTLPLGADTYLRSGSPNQNQGTEPILRLRASGNNRALLRVDSAAVATAVGSGTVTSARLELTITLNADNWGSTGRTIDLHRLTQAWTEAGATWNCGDDLDPGNQKPDCPLSAWEMGGAGPHPWIATPTDTQLLTNGLRGVITFDVTAGIQALLGGSAHPGWILKKTEEGPSGRVEFGSRESAAPPRLILDVRP